MTRQGNAFLARLLRGVVFAGLLLFYQSQIQAKLSNAELAAAWAQADQTKQQYELLKSRVDSLKGMESGQEVQTETQSGYQNGTYTGEGTGFGGTIQTEVLIEDGRIQDIQIVSAEKEDSAYLEMAKDVIQRILDAQNTEVDTVSGATFSSTGIREAVEKALEKAVKS